MKTELIYSKNRYEDIDHAIGQINAFRSRYRFLIETRFGQGTGLFRVLGNRLRMLLQPAGYSDLSESDRALEASQKELQDLRDLVEISNVLQDTYQKCGGKLDLRVKEKENKEYQVTILTQAYSDTLPGGGLITVPQMKKEYRITADAMEKIFRRGVVDFSWVDGCLSSQAQDLSSLSDTLFLLPAAQKMLPVKEALSAPDFEAPGDNPVDILD